MHFLSTMTNCSNMVGLDLMYNQLKGVLPNNIGNFSQFLKTLSLTGNQIYGGIPSAVGNLISLENLILQQNQLTGIIPSTIGNLYRLQLLSLYSNKLSGKFPEFLGNLSLMKELCLGDNKFEGTIPRSFGNCQQLSYLCLSLNSLSGFIPKEIFGISSLSVYLGISHNNLSGTIPLEVGNLNHLTEFDASQNRLSGELPVTLGGCSSLERLSLAGNLFQGSIPKFLSSMRGIQNLDLSNNNFSGQIPEFLEKLEIKTLNLSFNDLVGEVPTQGIFGNASAISIVGNTRLCGGIPKLDLPKCQHVKESKKHKKPALQESSNSVSAGIIRGTIGYVAPGKTKQYGLGAEVSSSGDIYSYGILLLEMMTGKRPTDSLFTEGLDLHRFVEMAIPDRVMDIVDPMILVHKEDPIKCSLLLEVCLIPLLKVGLDCSMDLPQDRMNMTEVVSTLKRIRNSTVKAEL
ncbi:hypothetical protein ACH5RR_011177 [Cinchona calisaya]|uniref:Disease resistance R13L4/SHOC-2-like LRR domain-containing protein n=1 Tax=Cinchona calisaya TaxID=153742 RepID=A0ABD3A448_9GENT